MYNPCIVIGDDQCDDESTEAQISRFTSSVGRTLTAALVQFTKADISTKEGWWKAYDRQVALRRSLHQLEDELEYWEELDDKQHASLQQMLEHVSAQLTQLDEWLLENHRWGE